jgi:hypothetical protein
MHKATQTFIKFNGHFYSGSIVSIQFLPAFAGVKKEKMKFLSL